jgi:uncharacterized metal-binding protein
MDKQYMIRIIEKAVCEELKACKEEMLQKAVKEFEQELRKKFVDASINITDYFEIDKQQETLVIRLKNG